MKRTVFSLVIVTALTVMMLPVVNPSAVLADVPEYDYWEEWIPEGDAVVECGQAGGCCEAASAYKIEPWVEGEPGDNDGTYGPIGILNSGNYSFTWTSTKSVTCVIIKAGQAGHIFSYCDGANGGSLDIRDYLPAGEKLNAISHVTFCFGVQPLLVSADITIHKTIGPDCPEETFRFEAWRDMNGNGVIDAGDIFQGEVDITGAGTGVITVSIFGQYLIHEVLEAGSAYGPHPDQSVFVTCDEHVYFHNVCEPPEFCELVILKTDTAGNPLGGACFTITPDPWTGTDSVTVCDNDANDECPEDGVFCLADLICELEVTVEETTVPDGYMGADPQIAVIGETLELTFVNTEEKCELTIYKEDGSGEPLAGACFNITPDPRTGVDSLVLCDNDANDECPEDGVFCLTDLICELEVTVEETTVPDGYVGADPQIAVIGETLELTFVNTEEKCELTIYKEDGRGEPLAGACFNITPDPRTGVDSLVLCDNDANDECPEDGVFCLTDLICELEVTVEETTVPDGYVGADPQIAVIGETLELTFVNAKQGPDICIEKLVDCNDDGVYLPRDTGSYGDTPSWYIRVWNCGNSSLLSVNVSDTNGMSWDPFDLVNRGDYWEIYYDGDPIFETTTNTAEAIAEDGFGDEVGPVYASATNVIENGNGGYSCTCCYECGGLTVDWEGTITTKPLYCSNDKLAVDCLAPSFDLSHNLFLERGTHAPVVYQTTHYLIVVRELEEIPALPENKEAIVVFNITPANAEFDKDIFLTLGIAELPANALNVTMAYYDDVNGVWELMESEAGGPSGVAELTLSAAINHFSIYGVLAELEPTTPQQPAHLVASGLNIEPTVEKLSVFVTKTGEGATITANVANDGGQGDTFTVELKLNGEVVDTEIVTLGAGQSKQVSFTVSELEYGQYDVEVAGMSDEFSTSRTIAWWLIIVIIVAVGLIIWGVVWGTRRKRKTQLEG